MLVKKPRYAEAAYLAPHNSRDNVNKYRYLHILYGNDDKSSARAIAAGRSAERAGHGPTTRTAGPCRHRPF
jgi:hypothetical protein